MVFNRKHSQNWCVKTTWVISINWCIKGWRGAVLNYAILYCVVPTNYMRLYCSVVLAITSIEEKTSKQEWYILIYEIRFMHPTNPHESDWIRLNKLGIDEAYSTALRVKVHDVFKPIFNFWCILGLKTPQVGSPRWTQQGCLQEIQWCTDHSQD